MKHIATEPSVVWEHLDGGWIELGCDTRELLRKVSALPGIIRVVGLADCHVGRQEAPTSSATVNESHVIPALGSNVINCGIGLVRLGVSAGQGIEPGIEELWRRILAHTHAPVGVWSGETVRLAIRGGAAAVAKAGLLPTEIADGFENRGVAPVNAGTLSNPKDWELTQIVPWNLLSMSVSRQPRKAVLLGNHFMEVQRIESDVMLTNGAGRPVLLRKGELVIMVHLDHRFTGAWNYHYVYRRLWGRKPSWYRMLFRASKMSFHKPWLWSRAGRTRWGYFFRDEEYIALPLGTPEAGRYLAAYAAARNYGYAARGEVYAAVLGAVRDVWPSSTPELVWDSAHESIECTSEGVVSRKGVAAAVPGQPALIAGSYDYPSFIGVVGPNGNHFLGYDHGSSYLAKLMDQHAPAVKGEEVTRWLADRQGNVAPVGSVPLRAVEGIRQQVSTLKEAGIIAEGAWATPVSNLGGWL